MEGAPKYDGHPVKIGGVEYTVPSLSVKQAKQQWTNIMDLAKPMTDTGDAGEILRRWTVSMPIIHAAFSRNYPDITLEQLEDMVDLSNYGEILKIVVAQSGLKPASGPAPAA